MSNEKSVVGRLQATVNTAHARGMETLDARITPQRRQELYQGAQTWANDHPKLTAFLAAQALLSLPPILLFLAYVTTLFLASTFAALALALTFVGIAAALACLILVPVLLITSATATGFFIAGYIAYIIAQKLATDPRLEPVRQRTIKTAQATSEQAHSTVLKAGNTANHLSGGRLEAALGEAQKALQENSESSSNGISEAGANYSTGMSTPVSQPPSYVDQAHSYSITTPVNDAVFNNEPGVTNVTRNGATDRVPVRSFDLPQALGQSSLRDVEKTAPARTMSRPALF